MKMKSVQPKVPDYMLEMGSPAKPKKDYPRIDFDLSTLPEAADWKMNGKYRITVEGELTSLSNNDGHGHIVLEVIAIGSEPMKEGRVSRKQERGSTSDATEGD